MRKWIKVAWGDSTNDKIAVTTTYEKGVAKLLFVSERNNTPVERRKNFTLVFGDKEVTKLTLRQDAHSGMGFLLREITKLFTPWRDGTDQVIEITIHDVDGFATIKAEAEDNRNYLTRLKNIEFSMFDGSLSLEVGSKPIVFDGVVITYDDTIITYPGEGKDVIIVYSKNKAHGSRI